MLHQLQLYISFGVHNFVWMHVCVCVCVCVCVWRVGGELKQEQEVKSKKVQENLC